jgi:hypothetical protein
MNNNPNELSFKSENLVLDWIAFNITSLKNEESVEYLAKYFQRFGFNSTIIKTNFKTFKTFPVLPENQFLVKFICSFEPNSHWTGTIVSFSGNNAIIFYDLLKQGCLNLSIFDLPNTTIGRLDVNYLRVPRNFEQEEPLEKFMEDTCQKIGKQSKKNQANWDRNKKGLILRIGSRSSALFYRIYEINNNVKFELEIKKVAVKQFQELLFSNNFEKFEDDLGKYFYNYSLKKLDWNTCYTDWLSIVSRELRREYDTPKLMTTYLTKFDGQEEEHNIIMFLQFMSYISWIRELENTKRDKMFYLLTFRVKDFLDFIGMDYSQYRLEKVLKFFKSFQMLKPFLKNFPNGSFRSSSVMPYLAAKKEGRSWVINMCISEELYFFKFPFAFPKDFLTYKNNYDCKLKLELILVLSTIDCKKTFYVRKFFEELNLSNKMITQIKRDIIYLLVELTMDELIEADFVVFLKKGNIKMVNINDFSTCLLSKAIYISFFERLNIEI